MTEDWIKDALNRAQIDAERADKIGAELAAFLDKETPAILDSWAVVSDPENVRAIASLLADNEGLAGAVNDMCAMFCIAGYYYCEAKYNKK